MNCFNTKSQNLKVSLMFLVPFSQALFYVDGSAVPLVLLPEL